MSNTQLLPLDRNLSMGRISKSKPLLNPANGSLLSTTPSPKLSPMAAQTSLSSLGGIKLPSLSPQSPLPVSSGLVGLAASPKVGTERSLSTLGTLPPSPSLGRLPSSNEIEAVRSSPRRSPAMVKPESPRMSESLLPPSPSLGRLPSSNEIEAVRSSPRRSPVMVGFETPRVIGSGLSGVGSGMSGLGMSGTLLPPSPSLGRLPSSNEIEAVRSSPRRSPVMKDNGLKGFPSMDKLSPITLPSIPVAKSLTSVPESNLKPLVTEKTEIKEASPSTASFENYQGMIRENDVETSLVDSGYLPVDKVLTKDDNGNLMCQYVKAIDETGRSVFVDLDCDGYVSVSPKDMVVTEKSQASVIPYSVKMGTYECASSDVCGVAFECDNEICTMTRSNEDLTPSETVFSQTKLPVTTEGHKHHGILDSHPIAYPIVSLSDVRANPEEVACSVRDTHNRLRNVSFAQTHKHTSELAQAQKALNTEVGRYCQIQRKTADALQRTIAQLEDIHTQYKKSPPANDEERENLRAVRFNLRKRHDMVVDYLKLSESMHERIGKIEELTSDLQAMNDYAEKLFAGLEGVFKE
jgi:hypothetical protein